MKIKLIDGVGMDESLRIPIYGYYAQGRHGRFLAGKTATVAAITGAAALLPPRSILQNPGNTSVLAVLPPVEALMLLMLS